MRFLDLMSPQVYDSDPGDIRPRWLLISTCLCGTSVFEMSKCVLNGYRPPQAQLSVRSNPH